MTTAQAVLELSSVAKTLGGKPALADMSLRCRAGEITALLGPNGAGKTTTVTIATGLRRADEGTARIFGVDCSSPLARRHFSLVPQQIDFPATVAVRELLDFVEGQRARSDLVPTRAELCERLGITELARRLVGGLSGGQRRRVAVVAGLVRAPGLLVLDEATTNLDEQARAIVWQLVGDYAHAGGAVLITSHILADIELHSDRVVVLAHGQTIRTGSVAEIRRLVTETEVRIALPPGTAAKAGAELAARGLGRVTHADDTGELRLLTEDPEDAVRWLLEPGRAGIGLSVTQPSLADAVEALVGEGSSRGGHPGVGTGEGDGMGHIHHGKGDSSTDGNPNDAARTGPASTAPRVGRADAAAGAGAGAGVIRNAARDADPDRVARHRRPGPAVRERAQR